MPLQYDRHEHIPTRTLLAGSCESSLEMRYRGNEKCNQWRQAQTCV